MNDDINKEKTLAKSEALLFAFNQAAEFFPEHKEAMKNHLKPYYISAMRDLQQDQSILITPEPLEPEFKDIWIGVKERVSKGKKAVTAFEEKRDDIKKLKYDHQKKLLVYLFGLAYFDNIAEQAPDESPFVIERSNDASDNGPEGPDQLPG